MPAPGICEEAIRTCFGLKLGLGVSRLRRGLRSAGGGGSVFVSFVSAACLRACAVFLLVLYLVAVGAVAVVSFGITGEEGEFFIIVVVAVVFAAMFVCYMQRAS